MSRPFRVRVRHAGLTTGLLLAFAIPSAALAHAELERSTPADGATVPSPFDGPITMGFSATLAGGSKADLIGPDGSRVASATVDGPGAAMTIALDAPLEPGAYEVRWVSVGDDGDLERGTIAFTVEAPAATPSPTASPTPAPSTAASAGALPSASAPLIPSAPSATPEEAPAAGTADVLLPIVAGLLVVAAGGAYLLTRRRAGSSR